MKKDAKLQVWKFPLTRLGVQAIRIPAGAHVLTVQSQNDTPCLWALCDVEAEQTVRHICVLATGAPAPRYGRLDYINTFQLQGGQLVFHAFEVEELSETSP